MCFNVVNLLNVVNVANEARRVFRKLCQSNLLNSMILLLK